MDIRKIIIVSAMVLMVFPVNAQRRKKAAPRKAAPPKVEVPAEDPRITEMLEATQRIVFFDSVVVDKTDFLKAYLLNSETGTLHAYNEFFDSSSQPYSTVYQNQLANKCWFAKDGRLYTSDLLGDQWSEPQELEGIGRFQRTNYPFMMADGQTLYFSAIGSEGIGGLDIYFTRYDSESGRYLKAENIGMPFNSEANDYMYVVNETDSIGYFATDRRQPEGKVCIYMFIPNKSRIIYSQDEFEESTIRSRARIDRIAETWGDGQARRDALQRLAALKAPAAQPKADRPADFAFVIDDATVYTSPTDFRSTDNRKRIVEYRNLCQRLSQLGDALDKAHNDYGQASAAERAALKTEILQNEKLFYALQEQTHQMEKQIRNAEIQTINQK